MREKVEAAINKIRPSLRGTDIVFIDATDGIVKVKILMSSCGPGLDKEMALEVLEEELKEQAPEVKQVVAV